jgi:hypothetical protein
VGTAELDMTYLCPDDNDEMENDSAFDAVIGATHMKKTDEFTV